MCRRLSNDERIALTCLQGLTSRKEPCLWLVRTEQDQFWLDWHQQKHHIDGYEPVTDWTMPLRVTVKFAKGQSYQMPSSIVAIFWRQTWRRAKT